MARARNIKPALFLNTDLAEIAPLGRLVFIGLWTLADYKGCLECNLKKIKAQILPYDDCDFESLMGNLEQYRFIRSYDVQGRKYIKIVNFEKHQNPHKNERTAGSDIPDISESKKITNKNNELAQDGTKPDLIGSGTEPIVLIPDSLNLIPDTNTKPLNGEPDLSTSDESKPQPTPQGLLCKKLKDLKFQSLNPSNPTLLKMLEAGATEQEFVDMAETVKVKTLPYLMKAVETARQQAASANVVTGDFAKKEKPWFLTASGIEAKGQELNLTQGSDETFPDYKNRVYKAAGVTGEMFRSAKADWGGK